MSMNCKQARKYLFAFADGQLSVQSNCEVLDHLKMCPSCSGIVDEHQAVRETIRRSFARIDVPAGLAARVRKSIATGTIVGPGAPVRSLRLVRCLKLVGLAAAIVLLTSAVWYWALWNPDSISPQGVPPFQSDPAWIAAMDVVRLHQRCVGKCEQQRHHEVDLPRDPEMLAYALQDRFDGKLASIVPDLSAHHLEFESASFCCPTDEDGCPAAHVMYVDHRNGLRFSVFSVPHWANIDACVRYEPFDRSNPFIQRVSPCEDMTVLAWHQKAATYICCGPVPPERIREIAMDIEVAWGRTDTNTLWADSEAEDRP